MKEASVDIGKLYALRSQTGGEVTNENGETLATLEANKQQHITAQESVWLVPDDCKVTKANFKFALAALGLLGGGSILPAGYTRLEYLESTGTQRLLLETLTVTDTDVITWRADRVKQVGTVDGHFSDMSLTVRFFHNYNWDRSNADFLKNGGLYDNIVPLVFSGEWELRRGQLTQNGTVYPLLDGTGSVTGFAVFAQQRSDGNVWPSAIKLYRWEVAGKCQLIPALDPTGAPCMFDLVTRTAFYNVGTGDFVTPQSGARTYSLRGRRVLPDWGKLTPTGLRRLYHTPANYEGELYDYALEHGYKHIVETEKPEVGYWVPVWHDREEIIELEWVETEPPVDELLNIE